MLMDLAEALAALFLLAIVAVGIDLWLFVRRHYR